MPRLGYKSNDKHHRLVTAETRLNTEELAIPNYGSGTLLVVLIFVILLDKKYFHYKHMIPQFMEFEEKCSMTFLNDHISIFAGRLKK